MTYQEIFNQTLSKIRLATGAALDNNEPLMRCLVKIMYDFSDDLKINNIIKDKDKDNDKQEFNNR